MKYFIILCSVIFILTSCGEDMVDGMDTEGPSQETGVKDIIPTGDEQFLNEDSDYIYNDDVLHTFELNLPDASLSFLDRDPTAEEYVEGSLSFMGETMSPIGIRYKGSIGAFVGCVSGNDWTNPSGAKTCPKLSMKIKINWEGSDYKFYGLKKLQFHSMNNDPTQMRERLGYWLFRAMDVPAPRCVHARLVINGRFVGIFALVEQIDGRFTRYNYDDGKGNLYKEVWPLHSDGEPFDEQVYLDNLKTNEDENPSVELIRNFGVDVRDATEDELQAVISNWMDVDEIVSYAVVDRTIRNDDGAFHWYCGGGGCSPHNFYWYEEPKNKVLHLIPWDLDHAFENIISNTNPVTPIADGWGESRSDCDPFGFGPFSLPQRSAACDKIVQGWASYTEEYNQALDEFKNGPFSRSNVDQLLDSWTEQITNATLEASKNHEDALSMERWESALFSLRGQIEYARTH